MFRQAGLAVLITTTMILPSFAADTDWGAMAKILGRGAVHQPGDVHRFNFPRSDLSVSIDGVAIQPGFALAPWLAFHPMGDLVLTQAEIAPVTMRLASGGIDVTAVHHHILRADPLPFYMHVEGHGDAAAMAQTLREALEQTKTPLETPAAARTQKELP